MVTAVKVVRGILREKGEGSVEMGAREGDRDRDREAQATISIGKTPKGLRACQ